MEILQINEAQFMAFTDRVQNMIATLSGKARQEDISCLERLIANFQMKTADFFREERKLNIGVVGQVKAGKSSFLNTLLFDGKEILPKASTPKTATLTKMEYAEENIIRIEYYTEEEWRVLEENAAVDLEDEIYTSAREIVSLVRQNGVDPHTYLSKKTEEKQFDSYEALISHLNDYVGEDGRFTPIVKAVTLFLHKKEFEGLSIVDTPGLNDPIASRTIRTKEFMEVCDVVFFLSQSGSFLDKSDWILLSSQLPQKGVKRLVLIASKYDSGVRDVLRERTEDDDIFGEDENTADTIPEARKIIRRKLRKRAKAKVEEFVRDLEARGSSKELIDVISQCANPLLVSSMTYNMSNKMPEAYSAEERNVYAALKKFSADMEEDLRLLGNFDEVQKIFDEVVDEKSEILERKARGFVPDAIEELRGLLLGFKEKAEKRMGVLSGSDGDVLVEKQQTVRKQIGNIRADIAGVFGELLVKLEEGKARGVRELRDVSRDYTEVKERTGSETHHDSYTTGFWFWKKTHYYTYETHYSYCVASDAVDNLRQFALEAFNKVEDVFTEALNLKEIRRKLLNVVVNNFDLSSASYDASLFCLMVEDVVNAIEFPVFKLNISSALDSIAGKFNGRLTREDDKEALKFALTKAVSDVFEELSRELTEKVKEYKASLNEINGKVQENMLTEINKEFEALIQAVENREAEIAGYQAYIDVLEEEVSKL